MSNLLWGGIDPGKLGGIAIIEGSKIVKLFKTPLINASKGVNLYDESNMDFIIGEMKELGVQLCAIEEQLIMPGLASMMVPCPKCRAMIPGTRIVQGVRTVASIWDGFGLWRGLLRGNKMPFTRVAPRDWQKALGISGTKDTKAASVLKAASLFPGQKFVKARHGEADAVNLAVFARMFSGYKRDAIDRYLEYRGEL